MTEKFAGKYSFDSQDNFDAYVKDIGKNCNFFPLFFHYYKFIIHRTKHGEKKIICKFQARCCH